MTDPSQNDFEVTFHKARKNGFLVFPDGLAFQKRLTRYIEIWIFLNDDNRTYSVERFNFWNDRVKNTVLAKNVTFDEAIEIANQQQYRKN